MLDQQFAAFTGNMGEQGQLLAKFVSSTGPLADGFKDIIATGGAATTDAGRQLQVLLGGAANDIANSLRSADDIPGAIARVRSILDANLEIPRTAAAAGVQNFLTDNFGAIQLFARGLTETNEQLELSRQKQLSGTDALGSAMVSASQNMAAFNMALEDAFLQKGLPMTAKALEAFTNVAIKATEELSNAIDMGLDLSAGNLTTKQAFNQVMGNDINAEEIDLGAAESGLARTAYAATGAYSFGMGGAAIGTAIMPVVGTAIGGAIGTLFGGALGLFAPEITKGIIESMSRYMGGPVSAGMPYIVGEKGPEAFIPDRDGTIIPNNMLAGPMTGFNAMNVPTPQTAQEVTIPASVTRTQESQGNAQMEMMQTQINKLDEMIRLMGRQITATDKVRTAVS